MGLSAGGPWAAWKRQHWKRETHIDNCNSSRSESDQKAASSRRAVVHAEGPAKQRAGAGLADVLVPGNRVRRCRTRTRPPHGRHAGQIVSLEASNSLCNCWNAVHPGALHFMTLGTVELQVATIPLRWRLVHRRGTRPCRGPRTCIPAARVAVGKSRCCMECSSPTQAAEIKETLQLLVVRVPSRWCPEQGRAGGQPRGQRTRTLPPRDGASGSAFHILKCCSACWAAFPCLSGTLSSTGSGIADTEQPARSMPSRHRRPDEPRGYEAVPRGKRGDYTCRWRGGWR